MVIPVGKAYQELELLEKTPAGVEVRQVLPVRFVPMTGEVQKRTPRER
jgi:protein-L-isoaspartate O-methyltransferase